MEIKQIEKLADNICAEMLISKHSKQYQEIVEIIGQNLAPKLMIMFDKNNVPYNPNLSNEQGLSAETLVSLQGAELKTKYRFIHFVEGLKDEWTVWTNKNDEYLGVITFHKKWKEWEFAPENYTGYTKQCLLDLADFIKQLKAPQSN